LALGAQVQLQQPQMAPTGLILSLMPSHLQAVVAVALPPWLAQPEVLAAVAEHKEIPRLMLAAQEIPQAQAQVKETMAVQVFTFPALMKVLVAEAVLAL
jgi:hypothetical protein